MTSSAKRRKRRGSLTKPLRTVAGVLTVAALVKELRHPSEDRTWHGSVAEIVPYDFRMPSVARARARLWSPESPQVLMPTVFGVGWTVNVGRVVALLRRAGRDG